MTTTDISSLPAEILILILEFNCSSLPVTRANAPSRRYEFLREACLISRCWRYPAQVALWSSTQLWTQHRAQQFLSSKATATGLASTELHLGGIRGGLGSRGVTALMATKVIARSMGVKKLTLSDFGKLSHDVLQGENLAGIKSLSIATNFTHSATFVPHFHLTHLHLFSGSFHPSFVDALFACSADTLHTLDLSLADVATGLEGVTRSLHLIAKSLRTLTLNRRMTPGLVGQLPLLVNLSSLTCHHSSDLAAILDQLPNSLSVLNLSLDYNLMDTIQVIEQRLVGPSLEGLKILRFAKAAHHKTLTVETAGFFEVCRAKGIVVDLS